MKFEIVKKDLVPIAVTCKLPFLEISLAAIDKLQKQKGSVQWGKSVNESIKIINLDFIKNKNFKFNI